MQDPSLFYRLPRGMALWEAAEALAHAVAEQKLDIQVEDKRVISLGCGAVPLVAMTCATLGAKEALATDHNAEVLELAAKNLASQAFETCKVQTKILDWTSSEDFAAKSDWAKFDVVIGAEVFYDENMFEHLVDTVDNLLDEGGKVILSSKRRHEDFQDNFFGKLQRRGFRLSQRLDDNRYERRQKIGSYGHDNDDQIPIQLFVFEKHGRGE